MTGARRLADSFVHLGAGASAIPQPPFDGMEWYAAYDERHGGDGPDGRLVSQHTFTEPWDSWEMHPAGEEVVLCTGGSMLLTQEFPDGRTESHRLEAGDYAINPRGVWHIADEVENCTCIFITSGEGTTHRPR